MNGEMYHSCSLVARAKQALKHNKVMEYTPMPYEKQAVFKFLPPTDSSNQVGYTANSVEAWYEECLRRGLIDIKFLTQADVKELHLLAFVNIRRNLITCFYDHGVVTYFTAHWEFDQTNRSWEITYTEHTWENAPSEKPIFPDNTTDFVHVLHRIEQLALAIDCNAFAKIFRKAAQTATGELAPTTEMNITLPSSKLKLFVAASIADVFGGMGSWNDSPPYMAHEKNLESEYNTLSNQLHNQLTLAILHSINEW